MIDACFARMARGTGVFAVALVACISPGLAQTLYSASAPTGSPPVENSWTKFTRSSDTRVIYVSSSTGSDANDGLSPATPIKSLAKGSALLRQGYPDWLLLKKGDVWTGDVAGSGLFGNNGFTGWQGRSAKEPVLISSYGTGARPVIQSFSSSGIGGAVIRSSATAPAYAINNVAITGLEFYSFKADPKNNAFTSAISNHSAISVLNPAKFILLEDNKMRFIGSGFQDTGGNLIVRRNTFVDAPPGGALYARRYANLLVEENLFDSNAWKKSGAPRTALTNNTYVQYSAGVGQVTAFRGNIVANASNVGLRSRHGGLMENNLVIGNTWGFDYGAGNGPIPSSTGQNAIKDNVVFLGPNAAYTPVGISVQGIRQPTLVTGNIIARNPSSPAAGGIALGADSAGVTVSKNTLVGWGPGTGGSPIGNSGTQNVVASDNFIGGISQATFAFQTMANYARSLGLTQTFEAFLQAVRMQSKDHWNPALTADAANDYIRAGFKLVGPGNPSPGGNPPIGGPPIGGPGRPGSESPAPVVSIGVAGDTVTFRHTGKLSATFQTSLLSTTGLENPTLDYAWRASGTENDDRLQVSWSADGAMFHRLADHVLGTNSEDFSPESILLPDDANNLTNIVLRFTFFGTQGDDTVFVDGINLSGALAPVPLPAALPLFATGLGAVSLVSWRRKRRQVAAS